ncbi:chromate efflux transporter [Anaeromyxobacter oryzae]|uniref:Chromate transporter n=1 Tax=Anaeromyxobacter oryzae TaxID=2918170 RepID=A0ABM7WQA4_9BACT|nr:chromate efflux transporter [Anaeromyxobacter oryzae]BDG01643.1 chromate transporter [Anaeromyxobacter oryzae]
MPAPPANRAQALRELASLFLRLGATAFGGPAAHIAMMEDEVVRRRGWLTRAELLDLLGATNLIPGPNSTELAIHVGHRRAGFPGLVVAGAAFILPAAVIVSAIAWAYVRFGRLPAVTGILLGVKPVVLAIIVQALVGFARSAVKGRFLALLGIASAAAAALGANELAVLAWAGALAVVVPAAARRRSSRRSPSPPAAPGVAPGLAPVASLPLAPVATLAAAAPLTLSKLFLVFLKIGSVLFGSGYVLLAFLRADLVERLGWLTEAQLLDAVAVGQVTPGPVFTTATFVGWILAGPAGAAAATAGIFLPAFFFVAVSGPFVPRLRASPVAGALLDGVNVASLALMAVVTWQLGRAAITGAPTALLALASAVLLVRFRVNSSWLVLGGAAIGIALAR